MGSSPITTKRTKEGSSPSKASMEVVDQVSEQAEIVPQQDTSHNEAPKVEKEVTAEAQGESKARDHFKRLEESKRETERELRLQREMNEKLMAMLGQLQTPTPKEPDEFSDVDRSDFLTYDKTEKLVKKEARAIAKEIVQTELGSIREEQKRHTHMAKLRKQFSDFDDVVNPSTLSLLEERDPELAASIIESKDPYRIGLQSYGYIKAYGLVEKADKAMEAKEVERKLEKNAKTVQTPQAYDKRPIAQAFHLDKAEQTKLYEEMMRYAGQASFGY